jgi:hypothetical protein
MSRPLNHSRVNSQKRVAEENRIYNRPPLYSQSYPKEPRPSDFGWIYLPFDGYRNMTWPELAFRGPNKFWELSNWPKLYGKISDQANKVKDLATRILPPPKYRNTHNFSIIVDADGVFEDIKIRRKTDQRKLSLKKGSKRIKRVAFLDISIVTKLNNSQLGSRRMSQCLKREFFEKCGIEPSAVAFRTFFREWKNFAPSCVAKERPKFVAW